MSIQFSTWSLILRRVFPLSFYLNPYGRNARRTATPQERRQRAQHSNRTLIKTLSPYLYVDTSVSYEREEREREDRERERERERKRKKWIREREIKREEARTLCFILLYVISALSKHRLIHKHGHQYSQRQERQPRCDLLHHIEQSVRMIKHNQSRRSSVLTHASFSFHRDISVHLFLSTLLLLFASFIVCRYVHVECTDERESKVHRYSQRLGAETEMSERQHPNSHHTSTHTHNTVLTNTIELTMIRVICELRERDSSVGWPFGDIIQYK